MQMSYHLEMQKDKPEAPNIAMPPIAQEPQVQQDPNPQETYEPAHPVASAQSEEQIQQEQTVVEQQSAPVYKDEAQQKRFKDMREAKERAEKERDAYYRKLQ